MDGDVRIIVASADDQTHPRSNLFFQTILFCIFGQLHRDGDSWPHMHTTARSATARVYSRGCAAAAGGPIQGVFSNPFPVLYIFQLIY